MREKIMIRYSLICVSQVMIMRRKSSCSRSNGPGGVLNDYDYDKWLFQTSEMIVAKKKKERCIKWHYLERTLLLCISSNNMLSASSYRQREKEWYYPQNLMRGFFFSFLCSYLVVSIKYCLFDEREKRKLFLFALFLFFISSCNQLCHHQFPLVIRKSSRQ